MLPRLLVEQNNQIELIKKSILQKLPISINYSGPTDEVLSGKRINIEPIVMGYNKQSNNLVIWAYVFKGVSKKGLPGWKMFRVDRINNIDLMLGQKPFDLTNLPGYEQGKAPNYMKSLSQVLVYSPYWYGKKQEPEIEIPKPKIPGNPPPSDTNPPEEKLDDYDIDKLPKISGIDNELLSRIKLKIKDVNNEKIISTQDMESFVKDIYRNKENEWKTYRSYIVGGNTRPDEGTRRVFDRESRKEVDDYLKKNNIKVSDGMEDLSETIKRYLRML